MTRIENFFQINHQVITLTIAVIGVIFLEIFIGLGIVFLPKWTIISGVILTFMFILCCFRLHWGMFFFILVEPFQFGAIEIQTPWANSALASIGAGIDLYIVVLMIILLAWAVRIAAKIDDISIILKDKHISFLIMLLIIWNGISIAWTPNTYIGFMQFFKLLTNIGIFYLLYVSINSVELLWRTAWVFLMLGILLWIISFITVYGVSLPEEIAKVSHNGIIWNETYDLIDRVQLNVLWKIQRDRGTAFCSPHKLSMMQNCIIAIGFALLLHIKKVKDRQWILVIGILILLLSSHSTALSKGGTISLLGMIGILFFISHQLRRKIIRNLLIFFFSLAIVFLLVQNTNFSEVAVNRYSSTSIEEVSLATRLEYWATILPPFKETLGRGLGVGGSFVLLSPVPHPHSTYFSILCDMGLIGVAIFSLLLLILFKESIPFLRYQKTFPHYLVLTSFGAVGAIMIHSLVDFYYNFTEFWLFFGFGMAALKLAKLEDERPDKNNNPGRDIT